MMIISSVELGHPPFEMLHLKVVEDPATKPLRLEVVNPGASTVAVPETLDQIPVPTAGVLEASTAEVVLHKS